MKPRSLRAPVFCTGVVVMSFAAGAQGQQFKDRTVANFPNPNPTEYTNYVEVADIDKDGDLDLIFANGGNFGSPGTPARLTVFINNGFGVFTDETDPRTKGIEGIFRGVTAGDCDADGDLDLIVSVDFVAQPLLLMNDGTGHFTDETVPRLPQMNLSSTRAQFGDIDNDGDLDIYINNGTTSRFGCGQNQVWMNDGNGFFTDETALRHPLGDVCQPMDVIFGDIDNDFDLDIRTGNRGTGNSKLYRNDGTGVFTDISGNVPSDSACYSYDFGDFNGDGNLDLIGANAGASNRELLLQNDGTGLFTDVSSQISPNTSGDDNDSKFFDLDNDGDLDLIIAALYQSREKIFLNDGNGNFTQDTSIITSVSDASLDVMVADFTGDNRLDIVTAQGEGGSFANRIYVNQTGAADSLPPTIVRTEQAPDTDDTDGPYVIRATVADSITSDRGFLDEGVVLKYTVAAGPEQEVVMVWSGNSIWRGEIPGQPGGGLVEYRVEALDFANNLGVGPTLSFTIDAGILPADFNGDGAVDAADLALLLDAWGPCTDCIGDLTGDGTVNAADLAELLDSWT